MKAESIKSKEERVSFIDKLKKDFESNKAEWENLSIDDYLEAIKGWIEDTSSLPSNPCWNTFAEILMPGKYYE